MMVFHCDRCRSEGQCTTVLGKDLCNECVADLREWLEMPPMKSASPRERHRALLNQVTAACRKAGFVSVEQVSTANKWERRKAWDALRQLARKGWLIDRGKGVFQVAAVAEAAE